jgi:hypothetical protein
MPSGGRRRDPSPYLRERAFTRPTTQRGQALADLRLRVDVAEALANGEGFRLHLTVRRLHVSLKDLWAAWGRSLARYDRVRAVYGVSSPRALVDPRASGPAKTGDVLDSPDAEYYRDIGYKLRQRSWSWQQIAKFLEIPVEQVQAYVRQEVQRLGAAELRNVEVARTFQVEQIDAMIAGIYDPATGTSLSGNPVPVKLEAIDRMVKLLDLKAKLLGLNAPTRIDLDARIVVMAQQMGADPDELREIAVDVLSQYQRAG